MQPNENPELIERYEAMRCSGKSIYFDSDEFEEIIEFYELCDDEEAINVAIEDGLKLHPQNQSLLLKKAFYLTSKKEYAQALSLANNFSGNSVDINIMLLKAEIFLHTDNLQSALSIFDIILEQAESELDFLDCVDILRSANRNKEALEYALKGKEQFFESLELSREIADIYYVLEDYDSAIRIYNEILDADPYSSEDWTDLGDLYNLKGDYENAIEAFDFSLAIDESDERTLYLKSNSLILNGNTQKAIETLLEYSEIVKRDETAYILISECYSEMKEYETAKYYAYKALEVKPDSILSLRRMVYVLLDNDHFSESLMYLDMAIEQTPDESDLHFLKADVLMSLNRFDDAEPEYLKALSIASDPDEKIDITYSLALLKQQLEQHTEALTYFEKTADFRPDYPDLFLKMAVSYAGSERFDKALIYLNKALIESTAGHSPKEIEAREKTINELKEILNI